MGFSTFVRAVSGRALMFEARKECSASLVAELNQMGLSGFAIRETTCKRGVSFSRSKQNEAKQKHAVNQRYAAANTEAAGRGILKALNRSSVYFFFF
ncbi:hypothetical protein [Hydrogenophaga sp. 5NK40-0174]|uniref:hypothetical protein n=1 Tax=Hydrogenophaga sp. 5NK40-0174 TaxID=3127649 RepID=UPI00333E4558